MFKNFKSQVLALVALVAGLVAAPAVFAQAVLPAGVQEEIDNSGELLVLGATSVIIAMVSFWALRKLGTKMGWW